MSALHTHNQGPFPRAVLYFVGAAVAVTIFAGAAVRTGVMPVLASPVALRAAEHLKPLATRELSFADRPDGSVAITDVATGKVVYSVVAGGKTGFIRGVMRGLARERRMNGVGPAAPFLLQSWPDGQLSLTDTATKRSIELTAFGTTNRAAFAGLLK